MNIIFTLVSIYKHAQDQFGVFDRRFSASTRTRSRYMYVAVSVCALVRSEIVSLIQSNNVINVQSVAQNSNCMYHSK